MLVYDTQGSHRAVLPYLQNGALLWLLSMSDSALYPPETGTGSPLGVESR